MQLSELLEFDAKHIWHPYSSMVDPLPVYMVESAQACTINLKDGRSLIDGMSSWWAVIHGYNHPVLNEALSRQAQKVSHVMFGGLSHEPAVELSKKLLEITPEALTRVFYSDSGSVSVEVAMKMAVQYWATQGKSKKSKFVTIKSGYHGDTWNAMSVSDTVKGMHKLFGPNLPVQFFADQPKSRFNEPLLPDDADSLDEICRNHKDELAAIILEPIVQGAGGMWFYSREYLEQVYEISRRYDLLLIFDEIATGFGRTGKLFACEHAGVEPDIMCLGKALSGGYMSFAATLTTEKVANAISNSGKKAFMHGPTFMANPLACAVSLASIDLLLQSDWSENISRIERQLKEELSPCAAMEHVVDVRVIGAIGVIELDNPVDVERTQKLLVERGVWLRPFRNLLYTMPPYIISKNELKKITEAICDVLAIMHD